MGSGLYIQSIDGKNVLKYNGKVIDSVVNGLDRSLGLYVNGKVLDIDGLTIACSSLPGNVVAAKDNAKFNEVELLDGLECVNITMGDYVKLRNGEPVEGYKRYNIHRIYNIVEDVSIAPVVSYSISDGVVEFTDGQVSAPKTNDMVYNSVSAELSEGTIDTDETVFDIRCPFVNVRHFDPKVAPNGTIDIHYYVDDRYLSSLKHGVFGKTFTVIIKTEQGATAKKTTYAGEFMLATPKFTSLGETWFSIEVIDSNGVGSAVQYYDVLVRNAVQENFYTMVEADLETYGIVPNDNDPVKAYDNKKGFRDLFAAVKNGTHNGTSYNGIVLLNRTYWINYHKDLSSNGSHDFGEQRYFKVNVSSKKITSVEEVTFEYVKGVFQNVDAFDLEHGVGTYYTSNVPVVGSNFGVPDGVRYMVHNTAYEGGDYITFPDDFTIDFNGATLRATPSTDLYKGVVVQMESNFNTHLKNGKIVGNYDTCDFYTSLIQQGVGKAGEGLSCVGVSGCKYCSLDNIEISQSMGYAGQWGGSYHTSPTEVKVTGSGNKRVDISTGEVVQAEDMCVLELTNSNNPTAISVQGFHEICLGRGGYGGYSLGKERELFYSFYDANGDYMNKTVKSKYYYLCKVPANAASVKITCYGGEGNFNPKDGVALFRDPAVSKDLIANKCTWRDTRTCAINPTLVKGMVYKDCYFTNVATKSGAQGVTSMIGDFEDGWQWLANVLLDGCVCDRGAGAKPWLTIDFCQGLNLVNCDGIFLQNTGGVENGFVEHSKIGECLIDACWKSYNPFVIYNDNEIGTLTISYNPKLGTQVGTIDPFVAMSDTTIKKKCLYPNLRLLGDSINGVE